jgi:hypothetical protein
MDESEILKSVADHKVPACDTAALGWILGHLTDHGMSRIEIEALSGLILSRIEKLKNDPVKLSQLEKALAQVNA